MGTTHLPNARPGAAARARAGAGGANGATTGRRLGATLEARLGTRALPVIVLAGFALRLVLSLGGGLDIDLDTMRAWALRLVSVPLGDFYAPDYFVDHLPGDLWILWGLANLYQLFSPEMRVDALPFLLLLKLVPAIADAGIGLLLYLIGRRLASPRAGLLAASLFTFNPGSLFLTGVWGQWDSVSACAALAALWLLLRGNTEWAFPVLTYAALIKPPFAALVPLFALVFLLRHVLPHTRWAAWSEQPHSAARSTDRGDALLRGVIAVVGSALVVLAILFPFNIGVPPFPTRWTIAERLDFALNVYPNTTLNAFTLWWPAVGNWKPDDQTFLLGLSARTCGVLLVGAAYVVIMARLVHAWRRFGDRALVWACLATAIALFVLPTAMHERYLFPALPFAALLAAIVPRPRLLPFYALLSLTFFLNLYYVYDYYEEALGLQFLYDSNLVPVAASLLNVGLLLYVLGLALPAAIPASLGGSVAGSPAGPNVVAASRARPATRAVAPAAPRRARGIDAVAPAEDELGWRALTRSRADIAIPVVLALIALALYLPRIGTPDQYVYDEVYHAYTGAQYAAGNADAYVWYTSAPPDTEPPIQGVAYEWTHPPLGKLFIAVGVLLFGDGPVGWRVACALFGAIGVAVAYWLGLRITARRSIAILAGGLLLVDGLYFVQSRTGMVDIFVLVFTLSALLAFHGFLTAPATAVRRPLLYTGLFMGLALATKWNAVYASGLIGLIALWRLYHYWQASGRRRPRPDDVTAFREHLVWVPAALIVLPLAVYVLSYLPFFLEGHSWGDFREVQRQMWYYHTHLVAEHDYASSWWEWPLNLRPVWYHGAYDGDLRINTYASGNPILFWAFLPAVAWVTWRWWRDRTRERGAQAALLILLIGFFGPWLPWAFSPRMAFAYHFLPSVPFGVLAVAVVLADLWRRREFGKVAVVGYVAAAVLAFAFFYPIYSSVPLSSSDFDARVWLESWR